MPLSQTKITISNIALATGAMHFSRIRAVAVGSVIRRSIGANGDQVTLVVEKADWPSGYDEHGEFQININPGEGPGAELTLKGYRLRAKMPVAMGRDIASPAADPVATQFEISLETSLRSRRDGFGGLLTEGTLNELNTEGLVDVNHADYKTNQELVDYCLDAIGIDHEPAPLTLDVGVDGTVIHSPGPLDWGNARPLNELEAILSRLGWTIVQLNDGKIAARRMLRAGQDINIPANISAVAEPYEFGTMPGVRSSKIIVTSGATRSTIVTSRRLQNSKGKNTNPLVWVIFDPQTSEWEAQPATALADYKAGLKSSDLTPEASKQLGQLYRAVRLSSEDLIKSSAFVNIPTTIDFGDFAKFAGGPGVVEASCCVKGAGDQLINVPKLAGTFARIDGLRAISGQGVFILPADAEYVRIETGDTGRRGDVRELADDDLVVTYAHEANTGVFVDDYFVVGFEFVVNAGVVSINTMSPAEVLLALDDSSVVKVAQPSLRRVMSRDDNSPLPVLISHNSVELIEIAKQLATARMGDSMVQAGPIVLRGIIDINPGDIDGAVTSVSWNPSTHTTVITINQHEVAGSFYDKLQRAAGHSTASGIGSIRLSRSSAALGDVRNSLQANDALPIDGTATPEGNPKLRGRTRSLAGVSGAQDGGVHTRRDLPTIIEQSSIYALITGATLISPNIWEYDWSEVRFDDGVPTATGATRTSVTHGKARNTMEMLNAATGVQGNGIDLNTLNSGYSVQSMTVGVSIVPLTGPHDATTAPIWYFSMANAVDGIC